ncbi:hypothetical protein HZ326_6149 [Fusarium oxysporum f. sp. albedinis]|nr:hypothetical protein HZ326_6149 [Fusarium oxysporum f. sp. albedinis]
MVWYATDGLATSAPLRNTGAIHLNYDESKRKDEIQKLATYMLKSYQSGLMLAKPSNNINKHFIKLDPICFALLCLAGSNHACTNGPWSF